MLDLGADRDAQHVARSPFRRGLPLEQGGHHAGRRLLSRRHLFVIVATEGDVPEGVCAARGPVRDRERRPLGCSPPGSTRPTATTSTAWPSPDRRCTSAATNAGSTTAKVSHPGIGAIDPATGLALAWNPHQSRDHGTMVLYATHRGVSVGSDGEEMGHEDHAGIGFAPLGDEADTRDPTVAVVTPSAGAVYARNRVVNAGFSVRMRQAVPGRRPVRAPWLMRGPRHRDGGDHPFTVTGTDQEGNETVVSRSYAVANGRPDARIRRGPAR